MKKNVALIALAIYMTTSVAAGESLALRNNSINFKKVVELSHQINTDIPLWPGDPPVVFENVATIENDGYYLRRFSIGEHSATHMNAPNTFFENGKGIDAYKPESLINPAVVIDIRNKTANNADYVIGIQDILAWEQHHGRIAHGSLVLFYTGWQERWPSPDQFINADTDGELHFPGIGGDTTQFLLEKRNIAGVGIDTHGADPGLDEEYATNMQILKRNGIVLECLGNLDKLPPKGSTLVIGLLKLKAGSGSPVSVLAFIP